MFSRCSVLSFSAFSRCTALSVLSRVLSRAQLLGSAGITQPEGERCVYIYMFGPLMRCSFGLILSFPSAGCCSQVFKGEVTRIILYCYKD